MVECTVHVLHTNSTHVGKDLYVHNPNERFESMLLYANTPSE